MRHSSQILLAVSLSGLLAPAAAAQTAASDPAAVIAELARRCQAARRYSYEGDLALDAQRDSMPLQLVGQAKVRLAFGKGGRHFVEVRPPGTDAYQLFCDGQKNWAFVPARKQYSEEEATPVAGDEQG